MSIELKEMKLEMLREKALRLECQFQLLNVEYVAVKKQIEELEKEVVNERNTSKTDN